MLNNKYHLPHNAIRIDEFDFMLKCIDIDNQYYTYEQLRYVFLKEQIKQNKLICFHPTYHNNLKNHNDIRIRKIYDSCIQEQSDENLTNLYLCQYTNKKTFKQVWNETVRDYTEFFAFLGLLPTFYKGRAGGDNRHYVSQRLKDYENGSILFEDLLLDFKYRNSSKDYDSIDMYSIKVRPFYVALKALNFYFSKGYERVNKYIISAIVTYSTTEDIEELLRVFYDPTKNIDYYQPLFDSSNYLAIKKELGRATLFLKPYLVEMGYANDMTGFYFKGSKDIDLSFYPTKVAFCNSIVNGLSITPVVGKILFKLYNFSKKHIKSIKHSDLFDENVDNVEKEFILNKLVELKCLSGYTDNYCSINNTVNQFSINPYTEFFDIEDCDYVSDIDKMVLYDNDFGILNRNDVFRNEVESLRQFALGSDGTLYESNLYNLIKRNFPSFQITWYGANATGKRLSDIAITTEVYDGEEKKKIVIILECKAGNAIKAYDERKEKDDVLNTLTKLKETSKDIDGVWYWVVNGDSLPSIDSHGGYRSNSLSKSFEEKLNDIQFSISETMRVPTIITGFSFNAIKDYLCYLNEKISDTSPINKVNVPHFWKWSKKFMNLQYVSVYKELRVD